jgi:hypothetical protein
MTASDPRKALLLDWLAALPADLGLQPAGMEPASADASFRRYFRVRAAALPGGTAIVMDAPPDKEDTTAFLRVADLMHEAGLHAPRVVAADRARGLLLLTDLGRQTFLQAIQQDGADPQPLFRAALDALLRWQQASRPGVLPAYDQALLARELTLFPEWYVGRHLRHALSDAQKQALAQVENLLIRSALAQPQVYVHRDYMPRNLMVSTPNPGILDFQDAVHGPVTYDLVSLTRDAFISWPEEQALDWTVRWWDAARKAGLLDGGGLGDDFGEFYRAFEWMGLQRHLKVLGIFARINYRDGKPHYLADTPRFVAYVRQAAGRYAALAPLLRLFDELEGAADWIGYTF